MDPKLFFEPVREEIIQSADESNNFFQNIHVNGEELPSFKDMDLALIGLEEDRESTVKLEGAADAIRKKLYSLKKGTGNFRIIDLGNLRNGATSEESSLRLKAVCEFLISRNILPVIFGGSHDMDYGQYMAYESLEKLVSFINVDAFLDIKDGDKLSGRHIEKILLK